MTLVWLQVMVLRFVYDSFVSHLSSWLQLASAQIKCMNWKTSPGVFGSLLGWNSRKGTFQVWYEVGRMLFDIDGCVDCKKLKSTDIAEYIYAPIVYVVPLYLNDRLSTVLSVFKP